MSHTIRQLGPADVGLMEQLNAVFAEAFGEVELHRGRHPRPEYLSRLLGRDDFVALVALDGQRVIGGLAAYQLRKFEQERSEMYIYDLAVAEPHRRRGIATALILELGRIAEARGAYVMFVQADHGDDPAIALYSRLGSREDVLHFDIPTGARR